MKINFMTMINNDVIEPNKVAEVYCQGQRIWKGLSENLSNLDEEYVFVNFDKTISNTFNEAFYKINVKPKKEIIVEAKKSYEDEMEYGLPEDQKYPLYDKAHVLSAIKFFNYCKEPEKQEILAKAIIEKMEKFNISFDSIGETNNLKNYLPIVKEELEETDSKKSKTEVLNNLRKDIQGEFDAIIDYDDRADTAEAAGFKELSNTLRDIRDEEKVHVGELQAQLKKIDPEYEKSLVDGEKEVQEETEEHLSESTDPDDDTPPDVEIHDDGDGKGKYFYGEGHRKIYPNNHELDEEMFVKNGKRSGEEFKTAYTNKSINDEKDFNQGQVIKLNGEEYVIEPNGKIAHSVKGDTRRKINFIKKVQLNNQTFTDDQITPAIEKAHNLQVRQAEEAKALLQKREDEKANKK